MELQLFRSYYPDGVNGEVSDGGTHLCFTIELPWKENAHGISCIPEGKYLIKKRFSKKHKNHLEIVGVPDRGEILIHIANNAVKELEGCIAPVTFLDGPGRGTYSKRATEKLYEYITDKMKSELVFLHITTKK